MLLKQDEKIQSQIAAYEVGDETDEMIYLNIEDAQKMPVKMNLALTALGPIYDGEYGQSILVKCADTQQYTDLTEIEDLLDINMPKKVEVKPFFREDSFFLKLGIKGSKYKATTVPLIDPKNPEKSGIDAGVPLVVSCDPGLWLNTKTDKAGMFLKVSKIVIDGGKKKRTKK